MKKPVNEPASEAVVETTAIVKHDETAPARVVDTFWTKQKRVAFRKVMEGIPILQIAKQIGVHRNTIHNWLGTVEWQKEMQVRVHSKQLSTKLRSLSRFDDLAEKVTTAALDALEGDEHGRLNPTLVGVLLKESREVTRTERELYGENMRPGTGSANAPQVPAININIGRGASTPGTEGEASNALDEISFRDFLLHVTKPGETIEAKDNDDALVLKTRAMLQETDVLDQLHEDDKTHNHAEAVAEEASKRRH